LQEDNYKERELERILVYSHMRSRIKGRGGKSFSCCWSRGVKKNEEVMGRPFKKARFDSNLGQGKDEELYRGEGKRSMLKEKSALSEQLIERG